MARRQRSRNLGFPDYAHRAYAEATLIDIDRTLSIGEGAIIRNDCGNAMRAYANANLRWGSANAHANSAGQDESWIRWTRRELQPRFEKIRRLGQQLADRCFCRAPVLNAASTKRRL
ncbi:MAG: hypothetical protein Q6370_014360 [Candidatus Sigynarchaeota archaeon]|jgi:hypothetical protein